MAKQTTTLKQKLDIVEELKASLIHTGDGSYRYLTHITDATIAMKLGVAPVNVAGIRRELYGNLAAPVKKGIHAELESLRHRIAVLEGKMGA